MGGLKDFLSSAGGGAIATGAAGLLGSIGSGRKAYHRSKKLMDKQFSMDKEMYDYQNAYNTPAQQMARLKAAGLNPALMYGQGTTGNASNQPQSKFTQLNPYMGEGAFAQNIGAGISLSLANANKKAIETKTALDAIKTVAETSDYKLRRETFEKYSLPFLQNTIRETSQNIRESNSRISLNEVKTQMEKENIKLSGYKQLEVQQLTAKIATDIALNQEVLAEYQKGFSRNPIKTVTQMFDIPDLNTTENQNKVIVTAASLASGRTLLRTVGNKLSQQGFFRAIIDLVKRKKIGFKRK